MSHKNRRQPPGHIQRCIGMIYLAACVSSGGMLLATEPVMPESLPRTTAVQGDDVRINASQFAGSRLPDALHSGQRPWAFTGSIEGGFPIPQWEVDLGPGKAQVVGNREFVYVVSRAESDEAQLLVQALRTQDGAVEWQQRQTGGKLDAQETFRGAVPSPQATPLLIGDRLVTVSFRGQLTAWDASSGRELWSQDLVEKHGAEPVQFGFSSSPIVDSTDPSRILVAAAGPAGGLLCMQADTGAPVWKAGFDSFSYATPVEADLGGVRQFVLVSQTAVFAVDRDGHMLWSYPLSHAGLTNVPTPLILDESRLLISGQGVEGIRCLQVRPPNETDSGDWQVKSVWFTKRQQTFYHNWLTANDEITLASTGDLLVALSNRDGAVLGRWRGFAECNLISVGDQLLTLGGQGRLGLLEQQASQLLQSASFDLKAGRCWTPPTWIDGRLYVRGEQKLLCLSFADAAGGTSWENTLDRPRALAIESAQAKDRDAAEQAVARIFSTFESKGPAAALSLYVRLRAQRPSPLDFEARQRLADEADAQGLTALAEQIRQQATEDFPDMAEVP